MPLASSSSRSAIDVGYGWPVKPFHTQHPIRANFGDPRIAPGNRDFHFGVDISAPDGTMVYATLAGRAYLHPSQPGDAVRIESASGDGRRFEYWHIVPIIRQGERTVAYVTPLGRVKKGAGHVHFAEVRGGAALNPLRAGALRPYRDTTVPRVSRIVFQSGSRVPRGNVTGVVDIVAEAYDQPPLPVPPPFADMPVTPALIRWRILRGGQQVVPWGTAVDFRRFKPPKELFGSFYAAGTRQNHPNRPGRYRFYLAHRWDSARLSPGHYRLEVAASDTHRNRGIARLDFTITAKR
jgi:hypothetical protein